MTTIATDAFTRANSGTLGANWATPGGLNALQIVSNACQGTSGSSGGAYTGAGAMALDHWAQCTYNATDDGGPTVRMASTGSGDFYFVDAWSGTSVALSKLVAGTWTIVSSVTFATPVSGDTIYLEAQGTTLQTRQNGTLRHNLTDSAINGSTVGGPYGGLFTATTTQVLDNFAMGDFTVNLPPGEHPGMTMAVQRRAYW